MRAFSAALATTIAATWLIATGCRGPRPIPIDATPAGRAASLNPNLDGVVIPPNIAPMGFVIQEKGDSFAVRATGREGKALEAISHDGAIRFAPDAWHHALAANRGAELTFETFAWEGDTCTAFVPFTVTVSDDEIDPYLTYRKIVPIFNDWHDVNIMQRDLTGFDEWPVVRGLELEDGCVNCHSFANHTTSTMTVGLRSQTIGSGTVLVANNQPVRLATKMGYSTWDPSGRIVVFSMNKVRQFFHNTGDEIRDVVDLDSDLAYYTLGDTEVRSCEPIADERRLETYPAWAPGSNDLYFCSAPILWDSSARMPPEHYDEVRYDLMRTTYNAETGRFEGLETVLSADEMGGSILLPKVSPDGRFVLVSVCDYGCFPIFRPSSDLCMLNVTTGRIERLPINSDQSESWHSWSSNGRWIAFSSKRDDGLFTRTYFSHVDESGRVAKPFGLPQRDPRFYESHLKTYTVPEFTRERVHVSPAQLAAAGKATHRLELTEPDISMTRATPSPGPAWQQAGGHGETEQQPTP